ncbi:MAG: restriction endonuclease subunit S, partial [Chloroflexi bacterium]|nr:restriction endonuclease subunit S [Chloroflexota bacterium]
DSGVECLGKVPSHWEVHRLGRLGTLSKGNGGSKDDEVEHGIPCIRYGDLYTTHQYFIKGSRSFISEESAYRYTSIHFGDVLFAASGETIPEIGKSAVNLISSKARCGGDIILFRAVREFDARFLGYLLDSRPIADQKAVMGRGITVMHIYGSQLKYLCLPLPPRSEQTAIARFLDHINSRIDRYIRAKEKLIALLEEQKQAIIHQGVTGRIDVRTGRPYPTYKPSGVEWLGDVPEHWEIKRLGQCGKLLKGNGGNKEDEVPSGVPCIRYGDLYTTHTYFISESRSFVSAEKNDEYTALQFGDVLFAASGETIAEIGKSAVNLMSSEACCGGDIILFRPKQKFDARYLGYMTDCCAAANQKAVMGRGITVMHIYGTQIKNLIIFIPPASEQSAIAQFLDVSVANIGDAITAARREIELLREFRTRLIADVVTGKLDVRSAATELPESMPDIDEDRVDAVQADASLRMTEERIAQEEESR